VTDAEVLTRVPASAFEPAPKVDSAVLRLRRRTQPIVALGARAPFYRVVQAAFRHRRKQIHNALGRELPVAEELLAAAFSGCSIDPERRPQTLSIEEWACLTAALAPLLEVAA
jgi:16S rRNA (adenine1518-N6/adenine1519-N6)-dimethyltransferase